VMSVFLSEVLSLSLLLLLPLSLSPYISTQKINFFLESDFAKLHGQIIGSNSGSCF